MLQTLPSIEDLARAFACTPCIKSEHPIHGVLSYEVEYETEADRINLAVLPLAQELTISLVTKNPSRIFRFALENVVAIRVARDEGQDQITIEFDSEALQPLNLWLGSTIVLIWGNQTRTLDDTPAWERS